MLVQESGESQLLHEVEGWGAREREMAGAADLHPDCSCNSKLCCGCASDSDVDEEIAPRCLRLYR